MEVWIIILFLAGQKIEVEYDFEKKKDCIEYGEAVIESYRSYFIHSKAWFWCLKEKRA